MLVFCRQLNRKKQTQQGNSMNEITQSKWFQVAAGFLTALTCVLVSSSLYMNFFYNNQSSLGVLLLPKLAIFPIFAASKKFTLATSFAVSYISLVGVNIFGAASSGLGFIPYNSVIFLFLSSLAITFEGLFLTFGIVTLFVFRLTQDNMKES